MTTDKKRANSIITVQTDMESGLQIFDVAGVGALYLHHKPDGDIKGLSSENQAYAAYHGMEQRIRDAGALGYDDAKKRYATPQEKYDAMKELVDYYNSGAVVWSVRGGVSEGSLLFRALMREKPERDAEKVKLAIKGWDAKQKRDLLESDRLAGIVQQLRKEDGRTIDADKLLAELD